MNPVAPAGSRFSLVCVGRVRAARGNVMPEEMFQFAGICWCVNGELELRYDGESVRLQPGWASICFPGTSALCSVVSEVAEMALLAVDGADAVKHILSVGLWEGEFPAGPPPGEWIDFLYDRLADADWDGDEVASSLAFDLLVRLGDTVRNKAADKLVYEAQRTIHTRWNDETLNVADIAKSLGVDRSTLYRRFSAVTGLGMLDYIVALRMKEARRLLKTTSRPIAEIGKSVGLPAPAYFSRLFAKHTGASPRTHRGRV